MTSRRALAGFALLAATACSPESGPTPIPPPPPPTVVSAVAAPGPHNVLSAVVSAALQHADSVAVRYGVGAALDSISSVVALSGDTADLPVLGLLPATAYSLQVVAWGADTFATGEKLAFTTGVLPANLPSFSAGGSDPSPGYVAFALDTWGLVIDNTGRVVWYRALTGGATLNFQPQATGRFVTHPVTAAPGDLRAWTEFDELGNVTRTLGCTRGLKSRFHDLLTEPDGAYWVLCDETRTMDLTAAGGDAAAQVTGTVVQHVLAGGETAFEWNAFDHFAITDLEPTLRTGPNVNFTHANSLDFDDEGHLLLSFRSLNEVTCIDTVSGAVRWRMGGRANQFTFPETGTPFVRQHGARAIGPGRLQVLDNLGQQDGTRVEQYAYSATGLTATRTGAMSAAPPVSAVLGGATQRLPGGRTLAAYGNGNRVQEYDDAGRVVWEIHDNPGYVYRATRIASLYRPGHGTPR
jgi:arylsulfate sulfotransferase